MSLRSRILPADPRATYLAAKADIDVAIQRVLASGTYIMGPELAAFESEFAAFLGVTGVVGVANGTDAIELALRACGVGAGDQVATVANTVTATVSAIVAVGARPVFVEIDSDTMLMSPEALETRLRAAGSAIKAVVPVHLYGQACDMPAIMEIARRHGVAVVEDCAQAHGALVGGKMAGAWGQLSAFSFYPTKNLGALGDAGAVAGSEAGLLEKCRLLRQYGWRKRYVSDLHGRNSRLDELQAAILRVRLARLAAENQRRAEIARQYLTGLRGLQALVLPVTAEGRTHTWHQFVVRAVRRDELQAHLAQQDILCGVLYPVPIHHQPAYREAMLSLPNTEKACAEVLSLPLHPSMSDDDVVRVLEGIRSMCERLTG